MKKLIVSILIPSLFLSLCGCYSAKQISRDEFIKPNLKKVTIKQYPDQKTFLITNDYTRYQIFEFSNNRNGDTLTILQGAQSLNKETTIPFSGKIAVSNIKNFEIVAEGMIETPLLFLGITVGLLLILLVLTYTPSFSFEEGK
jgi:hypothetical protein